jgi:predicted secreted protein
MAITGTGGAVKLNTNKVAEISNWSLDLGADDVEITSFDSNGWKEYLAGLKEWSGSIEGNFDSGDTTGYFNGQKAILNAWLNGQELEFTFEVSSGVTFKGEALVKPSIEVPVDDKASFSCDITGTGALTLPT